MKATHRVRNKLGNTVGFLIDGQTFVNNYITNKYVSNISNLSVTTSGVFRQKGGKLPEIRLKQLNRLLYQQIAKNNPFDRDCQKLFSDWKRFNSDKVLQIEGARQVGKTTEIKKFAYNNYEQVIYINLSVDNQEFVSKVIESGLNILSLHQYCQESGLPDYIDDKSTLLILDEIQVSQKAYNSIRLMRDNLKCDIVVTGSYLGRLLNREFFQPAGTIRLVRLEQMSFREFCRVFNEEGNLLSIDLFGGSNQNRYNNLYKLYNIYKQIGGYPDVVKEYVRNKDIERCKVVVSGLIEMFKNESRTYFEDERAVLIFEEVYKSAAQLMCSNKRGSGNKSLVDLTEIVSTNQKVLVSRNEVSKAINWLYYCRILGLCDLFNNGDIKDIQAARKIYFTDCGIASVALQSSNYSESSVQGALTENFVYCELNKLYENFNQNLTGNRPCFSTFGDFELDFVIVDVNRYAIGIEVKTNDGAHRSLNEYIKRKFIHKGVMVKNTKGGRSEKIDTIPIYTVGCRYPYK